MTPTIIKDTEQEKIYVYEVNKNGKYTFTANSENGRKDIDTVNVNNIIKKTIISTRQLEDTEDVQVIVEWGIEDEESISKLIGINNKDYKTYEGAITIKENCNVYAKIVDVATGKVIISEELSIQNIPYEWEVWNVEEEATYEIVSTKLSNGYVQTTDLGKTYYSSYEINPDKTGLQVSGSTRRLSSTTASFSGYYQSGLSVIYYSCSGGTTLNTVYSLKKNVTGYKKGNIRYTNTKDLIRVNTQLMEYKETSIMY